MGVAALCTSAKSRSDARYFRIRRRLSSALLRTRRLHRGTRARTFRTSARVRREGGREGEREAAICRRENGMGVTHCFCCGRKPRPDCPISTASNHVRSCAESFATSHAIAQRQLLRFELTSTSVKPPPSSARRGGREESEGKIGIDTWTAPTRPACVCALARAHISSTRCVDVQCV